MPIGEGWQRFFPAEAVRAWRPERFELPDGSSTEVVVAGSGPPLIAVPPLPGWKEVFIHQAAHFSTRYRFISFDLRGPRAGRRLSWADLVSDLDAVATAFADEPPVVIGHSMGGAVALHWALERPERMRALVLSSSFARIPFGPSLWWNRLAIQGAALLANAALPEAAALATARAMARRNLWIYDRRCDDALLGFIRWSTRHVDLRAARERVRLAITADLRSRLSGVRVPALVLWGAVEPRHTRRSGEELARGIPGAAGVALPGANHLGLISSARLFNETVEAWLAGL